MTKNDWLKNIREKLEESIRAAESLKDLEISVLNIRPDMESWSILQCIEHLNLYNRYYIGELQIKTHRTDSDDGNKMLSSWIGRKSIRMMDPSNAKKQKTFKHMQPAPTSFPITVLENFLADQQLLKKIIDDAGAGRYSLNCKSVRVEFFKLLKMYRGETLEFIIVHQLRHLRQARRIKDRLSLNRALIV